jgi:hypothetical protein
MAGPNYVLDKGYTVDPALAFPINFGEAVTLSSNTQVTQTSVATTSTLLGVAQFSVGYTTPGTADLTKIATGKVQIDVRLLGITRMVASAAVTRGAPVGVTAYNSGGTAASHGCRAVALVKAAAGAQPQPQIGIALTPAVNAGDTIDVLLTPGATY